MDSESALGSHQLNDSEGISGMAWLLSIAICLLLPVAIINSRGIAPLFTTVAIIALGIRARRGFGRMRLTSIEWSLVAFIVFATLSCLWSPRPLESVGTVAPVAAAMAGCCLLIREADSFGSTERRLMRRAVILGGLLGYGWLASILVRFELAETSILAIKTSMSIAILYLWPLAVALSHEFPGRRVIVLLAIASAAALVFTVPSHSDVVATIVGIMAALAAAILGKQVYKPFAAGLLVLVLGMPLFVSSLPDPTQPGSGLDFLPSSSLHRVDIWRNTMRHVAENPVLGLGFDTSHMLYGPETQRSIYLVPDSPNGPRGVLSEPIPLHPHNFVLQVWLEMGLVGASILCVFLLLLSRFMSDRLVDRLSKCSGLGLFAGILVIACVSYGAWQSWWICGIALLATTFRSVVSEKALV